MLMRTGVDRGPPVGVIVPMQVTVFMQMQVSVTPAAVCPPKSYSQVAGTKDTQAPRRPVPPGNLPSLDFPKTEAKPDPDESEHHAGRDMTEPTGEGEQADPPEAPTSSTTDDNKGKIVIRPQKCVHKADGNRCQKQGHCEMKLS